MLYVSLRIWVCGHSTCECSGSGAKEWVAALAFSTEQSHTTPYIINDITIIYECTLSMESEGQNI